MKSITRNIDPDCARDLVERGARACMAYGAGHGAQVIPVVVMLREGRYFVGVAGAGNRLPVAEQEVVLLADEGVRFFDLRALYIRGVVRPISEPAGAMAVCVWFEVAPVKRVAWDYGMLREADDEG